jgi:hypothetical protein
MGKRAGRLTIGGVRVRVGGGAWVVGVGGVVVAVRANHRIVVQNFRRQDEGLRPRATMNTVGPRRCIDLAICAPSPESSGPHF